MLYWVWLSTIKGIGPVTQRRLLDHFEFPEVIYRSSEKDLKKVVGVGEILSNNIKNKSLDDAKKILDKAHKLDIKILTCEDSLYPEEAKRSIDSPTVLYYRGQIKKNFTGVGIVGSRKCTEYGKQVTKEVATYLAKNGVCVISGMAKGIDGYAHTAALKAGGYTIAFLGSSVDICYPKEHLKLMESIIKNGVVISEYPPTTGIRAEHFPRRNFLISSFASKLLVVEAATNSGALITAKFSQELKREVYAVPNQIYSKSAQGTNHLIEKGAKIYLRPNQLIDYRESDVLDELTSNKIIRPLEDKKNKMKSQIKESEKYTSKEIEILNFINDIPKTIDQISNFLKCDGTEILEIISILELKGNIRSLPGGRYRIIVPVT